MHSVEALNPLHASAGIFRQIEDVYLAVGEDYFGEDGRVAQAVDAAFRVCHHVMIELSLVQQNVELARKDASRRRSVSYSAVSVTSTSNTAMRGSSWTTKTIGHHEL